MTYTTNYNLMLVEGTDVVNPLTQLNPNISDIDSQMKSNADATVARATCTKTGTTHAVVTSNSDAAMQRFTATGNWETGDTMTIDGVSVSVYLPDGTAPQTGCFVINSEVIIAINGSRVTLYAAPALSQQASDISYDNTLSGLAASDVQDALDELALAPKGMYALGIVTTDAGCTVTLTKGAKTVTCTEVSSGVYEGGIDEYGTWAVNNVTLGYSRNFTVDAVKIYNLSFIPDGRTITPVNDVQTLLHCAAIFDKGYTVLSQLIADTASLYTVITDNNAIDYLVRSTSFASGICGDQTAMTYIAADNYASNTLMSDATWAAAIAASTYRDTILSVKVPTMTSNTTPSGEVVGQSVGVNAYNFFNTVGDSCTSNVTPTNIVGYDFGTATRLGNASFTLTDVQNGSGRTVDVSLVQSDDGNTWTEVSSAVTATCPGTYNIITTSATSKRYFGFKVNGSLFQGGSFQILAKGQLYTRRDI